MRRRGEPLCLHKQQPKGGRHREFCGGSMESGRERCGGEIQIISMGGDMVVPPPPSYFGFTYDSGISNKSKLILSISFGRNIIEPNGGWGILLWKIINN